MKRLFIIFALLGSALGQVANTATCNSASDGADPPCTLTLHANSLVYVHAKRIGDNTPTTITVTDSAGLVYTERLHDQINTIACTWECGYSSVFDAQTGATSGSVTVTAHFSNPGHAGGPFLLIEVWEMSGVNTTSYFDTAHSAYTICSTGGGINQGSITAADTVTYQPTTAINGGGCNISDTTLLSQAVAYFTPLQELIMASNMGKTPICCVIAPFIDLSDSVVDSRQAFNTIYYQNPAPIAGGRHHVGIF